MATPIPCKFNKNSKACKDALAKQKEANNCPSSCIPDPDWRTKCPGDSGCCRTNKRNAKCSGKGNTCRSGNELYQCDGSVWQQKSLYVDTCTPQGACYVDKQYCKKGYECKNGSWRQMSNVVDSCPTDECYYDGQICTVGNKICQKGKWVKRSAIADQSQDRDMCSQCYERGGNTFFANPDCLRRCKKTNTNTRKRQTSIGYIPDDVFRDGTMLTTKGGDLAGKVLGVIPSKGQSGMVDPRDFNADPNAAVFWSLTDSNRLRSEYDRTPATTTPGKYYITGEDHHRSKAADLGFEFSPDAMWYYDKNTGNLELREKPFYPDKNYTLCARGGNKQGLYVGNKSQNMEGSSDDCKWISTDIIPLCCTAEEGSTIAGKYCGVFKPGSRKCEQVMSDVCAVDYNSARCQRYLDRDSNVVRSTVVKRLNEKFKGRNGYGYDSKKDKNDPFFTTDLPKLASSAPGALDGVLDTVCSYFTREDLKKDKTLARICGCHLPTGKTIDSSPNGLLLEPNHSYIPNQYKYSKRNCDPSCNVSDTIQRREGRCDESYCIIDNFNVKGKDSSGMNVNIDMNCGSCGSGGCQCFIDGAVIDAQRSKGLNVNLKQNCGKCYRLDGNSVADAKEIPCGGKGGGNGGSSERQDQLDIYENEVTTWIKNNKVMSIGIGAAVLFIFLLIILVVVIKKRGRGSTDSEIMIDLG